MVRILQVLVVDDSESDTQLLLEEIRQNQYDVFHQRVQTPAEFVSALGRRVWDVILSDYYMPEFSGPAALKLLQEEDLDIPFIVVSGTYGEDAAVDMMKAGADDFIVKDNFSRLVPAIEREMEAAQTRRERNRAENALRFLAAIVESSDDAIYGKTPDGTIVSWNRGAERIFGYRANDIIGRSIELLYPAGQRDELIGIMEQIRHGERVGRYDTVRQHKDGHGVPVSVTVSPIKNASGNIIGASIIARDITDRIRRDEERDKLIGELTEALGRVKTLSGLLPICSSCKRIRDDQGCWQQVETYLPSHSDATLAHSVCPDCARQFESEPVTEV
jgi:two-component system, cell cycle sensor histidine kinase and response regulator CckA